MTELQCFEFNASFDIDVVTEESGSIACLAFIPTRISSVLRVALLSIYLPSRIVSLLRVLFCLSVCHHAPYWLGAIPSCQTLLGAHTCLTGLRRHFFFSARLQVFRFRALCWLYFRCVLSSVVFFIKNYLEICFFLPNRRVLWYFPLRQSRPLSFA